MLVKERFEMHKSLTFSEDTIQRMVTILDMNGYEQDGDSLRFKGLGGRRDISFMTWFEVYDFILKNKATFSFK